MRKVPAEIPHQGRHTDHAGGSSGKVLKDTGKDKELTGGIEDEAF
jgi:hypothetical protein